MAMWVMILLSRLQMYRKFAVKCQLGPQDAGRAVIRDMCVLGKGKHKSTKAKRRMGNQWNNNLYITHTQRGDLLGQLNYTFT